MAIQGLLFQNSIPECRETQSFRLKRFFVYSIRDVFIINYFIKVKKVTAFKYLNISATIIQTE